MTAAELFEVVKDVPREAWGELDFIGGEWWDNETNDYVRPKRAANELIGSMTAWLVTKGSSPSISMRGDGENRRFITIGYKRPGAMSIVAALAAACKEAA